ncbi:radical SAM protein [Actinomadura physcomitrii]|uniref:radical SAM protein n=1 Tax=Actinomadura physcomitrii TaxID=2650748 RepID=UPI00136D25CD|nr:radical SAM protein [Actinomadura physcomitrii]
MTRRCNAACSFCQAPNTDRSTLTLGEMDVIGAVLESRDLSTIKLSGGEPTTRSDLPRIVTAFGLRGIKPVVITNGFRIDAPVFGALRAVDGELKFSVHRPGPDNDLVLRVSSFPRILANMEAARALRVPFSINAVVAPGDADRMKEMAAFAVEQGARKISFVPVVPRGRARARPEFEFDAPGVADVRDRVVELAADLEPYIVVRCIDIRKHDYWVIENDGSLWIERSRDEDDVLIMEKNQLMALGGRIRR